MLLTKFHVLRNQRNNMFIVYFSTLLAPTMPKIFLRNTTQCIIILYILLLSPSSSAPFSLPSPLLQTSSKNQIYKIQQCPIASDEWRLWPTKWADHPMMMHTQTRIFGSLPKIPISPSFPIKSLAIRRQLFYYYYYFHYHRMSFLSYSSILSG